MRLTLIFITLIFCSCLRAKTPQGPLGESAVKQGLDTYSSAVFAGGCFWCVESDFEKYDGVIDAVSGYTGGRTANPTYDDVSHKQTGHYEAVKVYYDESKISYNDLLEIFWRMVDPTDAEGQFVDRGHSYKTAIFYETEKEKKIAQASIESLSSSKRFTKPVVTPLIKAKVFYKAETYHQDYYKKKPVKYKYYRYRSGRDQFLDKAWGEEKKYKPKAKVDLKSMLTKIEYYVTQENGTEPPFKNKYWDNKKEGVYVDLISGEALFSSKHKFKSGTGWPSFTKPLSLQNIVEKEDNGIFSKRTEVRSKIGNAHLGHVFNDGPASTGLRYCINSASLRFISAEDLNKKGSEKLLKLFISTK